MNLQEKFTAEIEAFIELHDIDAAKFGRDALKDPCFVADLRNGRSPNLRTIERVRQHMAAVSSGIAPSAAPAVEGAAA